MNLEQRAINLKNAIEFTFGKLPADLGANLDDLIEYLKIKESDLKKTYDNEIQRQTKAQ